MSLTKEMIYSIDKQIKTMSTDELIMYYFSCRNQNIRYPNSYDKYRADASYNEIINRGAEDDAEQLTKNWGTLV